MTSEFNKLLEIKNLSVAFDTDEGYFRAVDDVSFYLEKGEIVGLVGESGCGKSVTCMSIPRLIPTPPAVFEKGEIFFKGENLLEIDPSRLRDIRGRAISMIFQEPSAALSPLHKVGKQMVEALLLHQDIDKKEAWAIAEKSLRDVKIPDAGARMHAYPYQLSGGMQQRVMIAMALLMRPDIVIADEPTTALDVTIQAQVFSLIREMRENNTAVLLITHDMGVIWEMCDRVIVMYASRIAEEGTLEDIFGKAAHPYTQGLLNSIPKLTGEAGRLSAIPGQVPSPLNYPKGCHFQDRCSHVTEQCGSSIPPLVELGGGHRSACFMAEELLLGKNND
ncbi:MAG: ABC transporter ATP-binding protein [Desulfobacterales bacterium]|nr:ABC transporter ATP-binding protein [Desulfobacterales bacterium]